MESRATGRTHGITYDVTQGVYRQSSTVGDAKSIAGAMTEDSIVRARVRPTTLLSGNSWVGLLARSKYPNDYVYVSLRANNTVTLRRGGHRERARKGDFLHCSPR